MKTSTKFIAIATLTIAATTTQGCGPKVTWTEVNQSPKVMLKRPVDSVQVFKDHAPDRPHVVVGTLTAFRKKRGKNDNINTFTAKLRRAAAKRGCDAIVVREIPQQLAGKHAPYQVDADCLVWTGEAVPKAPASSSVTEPAGCTKDTDCKGDRVCEHGSCVSPPPKAEPATTPADSSTGQACEQDSDCGEGRTCIQGKCEGNDAGASAPAQDASGAGQ